VIIYTELMYMFSRSPVKPGRSGNSFIVARHMVVDKEMEW